MIPQETANGLQLGGTPTWYTSRCARSRARPWPLPPQSSNVRGYECRSAGRAGVGPCGVLGRGVLRVGATVGGAMPRVFLAYLSSHCPPWRCHHLAPSAGAACTRRQSFSRCCVTAKKTCPCGSPCTAAGEREEVEGETGGVCGEWPSVAAPCPPLPQGRAHPATTLLHSEFCGMHCASAAWIARAGWGSTEGQRHRRTPQARTNHTTAVSKVATKLTA